MGPKNLGNEKKVKSKRNKHKFVQKVAKKIILLIPFVLSVSIRVVHEN